ncbi:transposase IS116/IS110/IS902 family protein [Rhodovulum sulfidophilum]|uniref:Transposase IS116/IS110/IS902 family protein n=1 Tax=Rhodovulum sulfidophilum TaxID=35806 RepID=A0A0D6B3U7_RHOSU|nr:transposase IS116/IS110/IS902 family protein [Rhodovulum sulfidophilum]
MCAKKTGSIEDLAVVGVDIGKDTFHLVGFDRSGQVVLRKQIKRLALDATFEKLPRCVVGMEACLSAHFVSRRLRDMGFDPRIIPAIYVKPFNKGQLNLQALHRVRARLVSRRTATINQIRAFLIEQGIAVRSGLRALRNSFEAILEQRRDEISARMRSILIGLYGDWLWLDDRIAAVSTEIEEISRTEENCANIMSIPGIGPAISTALVAAVGRGDAFDRGRDFAAWVGLVPRQFSTGGRKILGRITKRGSRYLRMLFVQAAKVIMMRPHRWQAFSFGAWLERAVSRMPRNKAAIALANKLARTAWSILRHRTRFDTPRDLAMEAI